MKKSFIAALMLLGPFLLSACGGEKGTQAQEANDYTPISAEEAKALMDRESDYIILDARTQEEYDDGHIEGAILMPEYEVSRQAADKLPDKEQLILVYCRSGRRSKIAASALAELGYTNVKEFGGIIDWPYDIVQ